MPESKSRIKDFLGLDNHQNNWWPALRENLFFYFAKASCSSFAHNHFLFSFSLMSFQKSLLYILYFNHIIQTFHSFTQQILQHLPSVRHWSGLQETSDSGCWQGICYMAIASCKGGWEVFSFSSFNDRWKTKEKRAQISVELIKLLFFHTFTSKTLKQIWIQIWQWKLFSWLLENPDTL